MDPNDLEGLSKKRRLEDDGVNGGDDDDDGSDNEHQTSKSRGTVTVQIFIKSESVRRCWERSTNLLTLPFAIGRDLYHDQ